MENCFHCGAAASYYMPKSKKWCCSKSSNSCPSVKERKKLAYLEKYGVDSPSKSPMVKAKIEATNLTKYGSKHITTANFFQKKAKETCLRNYGVENPSQSGEIKSRKSKTLRQNYGVESPMHSPIIRDRLRKTCVENWGVEHPFLLPEFQDRLKKIMLSRYGVDNPFKDPERFKVHTGAINRYGKKGKGMVSDAETDWLTEEQVTVRQKYIVGASGARYCVDGFKEDIVYEFLGIYWHGHPKYFSGINKSTKCSFAELFERTVFRINDIQQAGFIVLAIWEDGSIFTGLEQEEHDENL